MKQFSRIFIGLFALLFAGASQWVYAQNTPSFTDAEIAHIAYVANDIDVNYGVIALKKTANKDIVDFARSMINDHTSVIQQALELVNKLGVTPKDNGMSQDLMKGYEETAKLLNSKTGKDFEKAYIDNEVAYHEAVIGAIRGTLLPQISNKQFKDFVIAIMPALDAHLEHAKMVQKKIEA